MYKKRGWFIICRESHFCCFRTQNCLETPSFFLVQNDCRSVQQESTEIYFLPLKDHTWQHPATAHLKCKETPLQKHCSHYWGNLKFCSLRSSAQDVQNSRGACVTAWVTQWQTHSGWGHTCTASIAQHFRAGRIRNTTLLAQQAPEYSTATHSLQDISNMCHVQKGTGPDVANTCSNKHAFSR